MLYFKCPTCKTLLADKQIPFEEEVTKACDVKGISEADKDKRKMEILDKLEVRRYCCRMRMLTYIRQVDIVK